jgi:hypothetical protein
MELLGDVGPIEPHFSLFGHSVNLDTRKVHDLRRTCNWLRNRFARRGSSLRFGQDRCMVCAECTTSKEIFLATSDGPPR